MENVIKIPATQYYVVVDGHSWASFVITDKGDLFINSDWGYWACNWRAFGKDFKAFLSDMYPDYLMNNIIRQQLMFGGKKTIQKRVEEAITALFKKFQEELRNELQTISDGRN